MKTCCAALVLLATTTAAVAAPELPPVEGRPAGPGFRLVGNAQLLASTLDFDGTREVTLYAEAGQIASRYRAKSALMGDLGVQRNFGRTLAVLVAFETGSRGQEADAEARLPHPFYLNRLRTATARLSGLSFRQTAGHVGLALRGGARSLEYTAFAGPSFYQVQAGQVGDFLAEEEYPFDTVAGTFTKTRSRKSAFGFHVGGRADVWLARTFGLGAQVRYGHAKVALGSSGSKTDVTAGGLEVGGGLRLRF
jgi:hypothetical protein